MKNSILSGLLIAICVMGDSFLYASLPSSAAQLGVSVEAVVIILSINRWVRIFVSPLLNWFYKKIHPKTVLKIGVLVAILTTGSYSFHLPFSIWILSRVLWGFAFALLRLSMVHTATTNHHSSLKNLSIGIALQEIGPLVSYLLGTFLLNAHLSSQNVFAIYSLFSLLGFYLISRISFTTKSYRGLTARAALKRKVFYFPSSSFEWVTFITATMAASIPILLPEVWKLEPMDFDGSANFSSVFLALQRAAYLLPAVLFLVWHPQKITFQISFFGLVFCFTSLSLKINPLISIFIFVMLTPFPRLLSLSSKASSLETLSRLTCIHDLGLAFGPLCGSTVAYFWFF